MITRVLFANRRKMINKNFAKLFMNDKLAAKDLNLDLSQRPGELSNEMFYKIVMKYEKLFN
jgi:16S rRNA A1518/A1519 N6-dimethyltransferase RsmA/KsgA/DIM1 with predicted DNA glycosylase/AP lyase activity